MQRSCIACTDFSLHAKPCSVGAMSLGSLNGVYNCSDREHDPAALQTWRRASHARAICRTARRPIVVLSSVGCSLGEVEYS